MPSAPSHLNFGVEAFKLHSGIVDAELPIDGPLLHVRAFGPDPDFALQFRHLGYSAITQTLLRHATQLAFRDVEPAPMLRRVTEICIHF